MSTDADREALAKVLGDHGSPTHTEGVPGDEYDCCADAIIAALGSLGWVKAGEVVLHLRARGAVAAAAQREHDIAEGLPMIATSTANEAEWYQMANWAAHEVQMMVARQTFRVGRPPAPDTTKEPTP